MRGQEPGWWYQNAPSWHARLLRPAAFVWGQVAEANHRRGAHVTPALPVICIGNFTAGGTGKTPLALWIAGEAVRLGARPAFLSRGYGGRLAGPHWVSSERDSARDVGDEPLLLARVAPTLIARDRVAGAKVIVAAQSDAGRAFDVIIMDDGLQNGSLTKSLTLAVVDRRRGLGNGLVIPAGPLRAPMAFQAGLADAIIVNGAEGADRGADAAPLLSGITFERPVLAATTRPVGDTGWLKGQTLVAFSGIGAPERFFGLLERLGGKLCGVHAFADHHIFNDADAQRLIEAARGQGAMLVTTEKDHVRLNGSEALAELARQARVLAIGATFAEADEVRLSRMIAGLLLRR